MICCVIVLRLLAWVYERCGLATGVGGATGTRPRRVPGALLSLLAAIEIAMAVVLLRMLRAPHSAGHMRHDAGHMHAPHPVPTWAAIAAAVAVAAVGAAVCLASRRRSTAVVAAGLLLGTGTTTLSESTAMGSSHVVAMIVLESLTVVTPLCLIGIGWNPGLADDVWAIGRAAVSIAAALGVVAVIISTHANSMYRTAWLGAHWWAGPVALAISAVFWASVLRFRLPGPFRVIIIGLVLEVGSLLAIAMFLSTAPMDSRGALGLSALADQRLAGLLMMSVDAALVASWFRAGALASFRRMSARAST